METLYLACVGIGIALAITILIFVAVYGIDALADRMPKLNINIDLTPTAAFFISFIVLSITMIGATFEFNKYQVKSDVNNDMEYGVSEYSENW